MKRKFKKKVIFMNFEEFYKKNFVILAILIFIVTQVLLYYFLYVQIGRFTGDFKDWWFTGGHAVLDGKIPYKDFDTRHSPLFAYLLGASYLIIGHYSAPILLFMFFSVLTTVLLYKTLEITSPQQKEKLSILFLSSPILWVFTVVLYQDEIISSFFLISAVFLWLSNKKHYSILLMGLGLAFTKIIFLIFIIPFLINSDSKFRHGIILAAVILITFLPFSVIGADVFHPIKTEMLSIQGPVIWTVMNFFGLNFSEYAFFIFIVALLITYFLIYYYKIKLLDSIILTGLIFMLFFSKPIEFYTLIFIPIFFLFIANKTAVERKLFYFYSILIPISYFFITPLYYVGGGLTNHVIIFVHKYLPIITNFITSLLIVLFVNAIEILFVYKILIKNIIHKH